MVTAAVMLTAADALTEHFPTFKVPVFVIHGTADKATRPAGSEKFFDLAGSSDKTLKLYEGHYHDLLADVDKEIVMADILDWVNARLPAHAAAGSGA